VGAGHLASVELAWTAAVPATLSRHLD